MPDTAVRMPPHCKKWPEEGNCQAQLDCQIPHLNGVVHTELQDEGAVDPQGRGSQGSDHDAGEQRRHPRGRAHADVAGRQAHERQRAAAQQVRRPARNGYNIFFRNYGLSSSDQRAEESAFFSGFIRDAAPGTGTRATGAQMRGMCGVLLEAKVEGRVKASTHARDSP